MTPAHSGAGVLSGLTIIEMAGIGPGPFCAMMLADHGATVIRVERPGASPEPRDPLLRSRQILQLDLKSPADVATLRSLVKNADGLIEGYRPGVMERLGLGPNVLHADNPRLVYGRMTGWGQSGPLSQAAGHDINYVALTGTLHGCGRAGEKPTPPINLVADFGGGAMMLAFGMVSALLNVARGGDGQVIDCAMTDGAALLNAMTWGWLGMGEWRDERGVNLLDTGAHFYDTFECADGKYIALGAIEPQFYALFRAKAGLSDDADFDDQMNADLWPLLKARLTSLFLERPRADWCALLEGTDACFAPVLSMAEAPLHPHNVARGTFLQLAGVTQPAPAPRFSRSPAVPPFTAKPFAGFSDT